MMPITQGRLKELLHYDQHLGEFTRLLRVSNTQVGDRAGYTTRGGYVAVGLDNRYYLAHRLAFLWMVGEMPKYVDHINGDKLDNRWSNLRAATHGENMQNLKGPRTDNLVGYLGVSPEGRRFRAQIRVGGKPMRLGSFATPEEAHQAYLKAKRELHAGCTI